MGAWLKHGGPSGPQVEVPGLASLRWAGTDGWEKHGVCTDLKAHRVVGGSGSIGAERGA